MPAPRPVRAPATVPTLILTLALALAMLVGAVASGPAAAAIHAPGLATMPWVVQVSDAGISVERATQIVRSAYGGRVVSAVPARRGNETGYRVRVVLDDGHVRNVFVNSEGRIRNNGGG